ncbi:MAG: Na+/H+ antiporter subunit E [Ilumatobacter sp.]|uniref:Na+/H+ antiporter subunit E n=1 Tax=Ilumatobacter sp. TaxID=1967498 RepID=UPI002625B2FB|nr:Na+/H+ antiporter subunit E [Ilumatobacter sp.]MDJ0769118.1 Na+/H+ antiporter subunit E [Ilumatobacter sp.]
MTRASGIVVWLIALWVLLWGDLSWANVLSGAVVAVVVVTVARLPRLARRRDADVARVSLPATLWFGVYVLYKLVESNVVLAWEIVTPRNRINAGVVAVPLRTESRMAMMTVANVITLTPGTMTIEVAGSPPVIYVNVLHLHDIEDVRRDLLRIEELSVRAFGSRAARAQLADQTSDRIDEGSPA